MRKKTLIAVSLVVTLLAVVAATAYAKELTAGPIVVNAEGGFTPQALPKHENAPITLHGGGSISTSDGSLPPILRTLTLEFDRHGAVQTTGLEVCTSGKLQRPRPSRPAAPVRTRSSARAPAPRRSPSPNPRRST